MSEPNVRLLILVLEDISDKKTARAAKAIAFSNTGRQLAYSVN